jgi:hypothetical protein
MGALGASMSWSVSATSKDPVTTSVPSPASTASSGTATWFVTPLTVRSPTAVAATVAPTAGTAPRSIGSVNVNVVSACSGTPRASRARLSRRLWSVASSDRSAVTVASVMVVPSSRIVPVTAGVRPTAVAAPMVANSSSIRKPMNVPCESVNE